MEKQLAYKEDLDLQDAVKYIEGSAQNLDHLKTWDHLNSFQKMEQANEDLSNIEKASQGPVDTDEVVSDYVVDTYETDTGNEEKERSVLTAIVEVSREGDQSNSADVLNRLDDDTIRRNLAIALEDGLDQREAQEVLRELDDAQERELLGQGLQTAELYIVDNGIDPRIAKNIPEAWSEERQNFHKAELQIAQETAKDLSERLGRPPRIIAMRGGCGSGKSFAVKRMYGDRGIFDDNGDVPGAVKPDYFKTRIIQEGRRREIELTSDQVHMESTGVNSMFTDKLAHDPEQSLLIDKQLESKDDISKLIDMAKETGKPIELLDNDVPIELSAYRVLSRDVGGTDPNIQFDGVAKGFLGIRTNREKVYNEVHSEPVVEQYILRAFDPVSKQQIEIARKQNGTVVVAEGYEELAEKVIFQDSNQAVQEISRAGNQIINQGYVDSFVNRFFDESERGLRSATEARKIFGAYVGLEMTMEEVMLSKAEGIEANPDSPEYTSDYREKLVVWRQTKREKTI